MSKKKRKPPHNTQQSAKKRSTILNKERRNTAYNLLCKNINLYSNSFSVPPDTPCTDLHIDPSFESSYHSFQSTNPKTLDPLTPLETVDYVYRASECFLNFSPSQEKTFKIILEGYRRMYNATVKIINTKHYNYTQLIKTGGQIPKKRKHKAIPKNPNDPPKEKKPKPDPTQVKTTKKKSSGLKLRDRTKKTRAPKNIPDELVPLDPQKTPPKYADDHPKMKKYYEKLERVKKENAEIDAENKRVDEQFSFFPSFENLRDCPHLQQVRKHIVNQLQIPVIVNGKTIMKNIPYKLLVGAIKQVADAYASCIANLKAGNIRHFRIRYFRMSKTDFSIDVEDNLFSKTGQFISSIFIDPITMISIDPSPYQDPTKVFKLSDLKTRNPHLAGTLKLSYKPSAPKTKRFCLHVPAIKATDQPAGQSDFISLDPGIRKFLTGYSSSQVTKIGTNIGSKIKNYLQRMDRYNNNVLIPNRIKKKNEEMCYRKIQNYTKECHYKIANYLTKNYKTIFLGNWSTKATNSKDGNLPAMTKRIAQNLSLYKFRQILEQKCVQKRVQYVLVDEMYTSKSCSRCGMKNEKLGSSEVYKCVNGKCGVEMDRDVNGARNILFRGINEKYKMEVA